MMKKIKKIFEFRKENEFQRKKILEGLENGLIRKCITNRGTSG